MPPARCGACKRKSRFLGQPHGVLYRFMKRKPSGLYRPEGLLFAGERRLWFPLQGAILYRPGSHPGRIWNPPLHGFFAPETRGFPGWCGTYRTTVGRDALIPPDPCAAANTRGRDKSRPYGQRRGRGHCGGAPPHVGADSISARFTPRADMESAPTRFFRAGNAWISRVVRYIQNDRRAGCPHPAGPLRRRERPREGHGPPPVNRNPYCGRMGNCKPHDTTYLCRGRCLHRPAGPCAAAIPRIARNIKFIRKNETNPSRL